MKFIAGIALIIASFSLQAETCFTRTTSIQTNEVTLASTLCFAKPELELNYFEDSYALLRYSIDGQRAFKRAKLSGKFNNAGKYMVEVSIEKNSEGGFCDRYFEANSSLTLSVAKDGSSAEVIGLKGEILYTYDQCHDQPDVQQVIDYTKL